MEATVLKAKPARVGRRRVGRAAAVLILLFLRQILVSWFLFKPFFLRINGRPNLRERAYELPTAPYWSLVKLRLLWMARVWASGDNSAAKQKLDASFKQTLGKIEAYVAAHSKLQTEEMPLPEYDWQNGNPEDFYKRFVKTPMPVVLRGYALQTEAAKKWNFDSILERCGDVQVNLTGPTTDWMGPLKQVRDPTIYCANADAPFKYAPELSEELSVPKLKPYIKRTNTFNQLFIGRKGTGSGYHCAGVWNFFYMIEGSKKWVFVDPELTWMMYPSLHIGVLAFSSLLSFPDRSDLDFYSLYKYAPRYSVTLQPGDVLFNPPWWWHAVDNLTPTSVAVATRWDAVKRDMSFYELNRMLSLLAVFNTSFPKFLFDFLTLDDGGGKESVMRVGAGAFDEDVNFAPQNQKARSANTYHGMVVEKIRAREKW